MTPWFATLPFLHLIDFSTQEIYQGARFEKDTRYYVIRLEKDLFDYWTITIINGRIKSKLGQSRTIAFANFSETFQNFCDLAKLRYQRDYHLTSLNCHASILLIFILTLSIAIKTCENRTDSEKIKPKYRGTKNTLMPKMPSTLTSTPAYQQIGFSF